MIKSRVIHFLSPPVRDDSITYLLSVSCGCLLLTNVNQECGTAPSITQYFQTIPELLRLYLKSLMLLIGVAMITRCSDTLFPSGIQSCTVRICIFPALTCLLAPLDLSDSLCCKILKRNNDHFHQLHLQLPTLSFSLAKEPGTDHHMALSGSEQAGRGAPLANLQ